ncbi:PREDICTED: transcription initiation factor TFIID subunit 8-like [Tarenaya hassleriana]|uniref:transcription initiation factor TFIID subunit 8-like n=1 Tax=Tarenaya hassleriana TaxID=28532 RepID=UPI00053C0D39|nr:PREDICTED: transcription initiation factor TFIID subunit 8-like [Tarenaya hassleriana]
MSNGGGESGCQQRELHVKRKFHRNDFAYAVARLAVAQTCESVEINTLQESQVHEGVRFNSFQESALETLTDVVVRYVQSIGKTALLYANMAGRTEGNALDVVQALEDLGSGLGFAGASDIDQCLTDSSVVKDLIRYIGEAEEMPFAYSLPCFPIDKGKRLAPSFSEIGAEPPEEHIPVWLPAFPETKIPIQPEVGNERALDGDSGKAELDMQSKEQGYAHLTMQRSSRGDGLEFHKSVQVDVEKSTGEAKGNPFLASPLRFGEKEVSLVLRPAELSNVVASINHDPKIHTSNNLVPLLEAFAPANEIAEKRSESEDGEKKEPARTRQLVHFKIGTRKTSMGWPVNRNLEDKNNEKVAAWFRDDDEKNEKKPENEGNFETMTEGLTEM